MNIGEAAKKSGLTVKTVRYYDEINLIKPAKNEATNYRQYTDAELAKLQFIGKARRFNFSIKECKELLEKENSGLLADMQRSEDTREQEHDILMSEIDNLKMERRALEKTIEMMEREDKEDPKAAPSVSLGKSRGEDTCGEREVWNLAQADSVSSLVLAPGLVLRVLEVAPQGPRGVVGAGSRRRRCRSTGDGRAPGCRALDLSGEGRDGRGAGRVGRRRRRRDQVQRRPQAQQQHSIDQHEGRVGTPRRAADGRHEGRAPAQRLQKPTALAREGLAGL